VPRSTWKSTGPPFPARPAVPLRSRIRTANAYVQSDDPGLRRTATAVSGEETDVWKTALKLERWVAEVMHFDLGIALAPSTELFMNRRGTCLGYATLLAALTRAAGIPSRVAMGYVYAQGMFGGHAWTEILVDDAWIPLDSAIVAPGTADPARFSLMTSSLSGGAGSLTGGAAQALFGQIDVRILEFAGPDGRPVIVPQNATPYRADGGAYDNPWLGIAVTVPKGWKFTKLDAVWPDPAILGLGGPGGATAELQEAPLFPWEGGGAGLKRALERSVPGGKERRLRISGRAGLALESSEKAALGVPDGPGVWILVVSGKNSPSVLAQLAAGCVFK